MTGIPLGSCADLYSCMTYRNGSFIEQCPSCVTDIQSAMLHQCMSLDTTGIAAMAIYSEEPVPVNGELA